LGEVRKEDLIQVVNLIQAEDEPINERAASLKMEASKHQVEIYGMNLAYALEAYDWGAWMPMTDDGVTVCDFWESRKGFGFPKGYVAYESGTHLKRKI
jgi:hypothetical protein